MTRLLFWAQANAAAASSHLQELAGDNVRVTATASYGNGSTQVRRGLGYGHTDGVGYSARVLME